MPRFFSINGLTLATLLSLGLHGVFVLWAGNVSQAGKRASLSPPRLQLTLRASPQTVPFTRASGTSPEMETVARKPVLNPRSKPNPAALTPWVDTEPAPGVSSSPAEVAASPDPATGSEPRVAVFPNPEKPIQTDLDRAARQSLRQSGQKSLATRSQEQLDGPNARASAFEKSFNQHLASANQAGAIVSETAMADGSRLVKFSGGTCMRFPNPAISTPAKPAQAMVTSCD